MTYRLLALDLDGTLLTSRKDISPVTAASLADLSERGVVCCFCTGRNTVEMLDFPRRLPCVRYGVLASGAFVYDFERECELGSRALEVDAIIAAMGIAAREDCMPHVMAKRASVVRPEDILRMPQFGMGVYQTMFENVCEQVTDLASWVRGHPGDVAKLNFYHRTSESRDRTRRRIEASELPLTLANAEETSVECSARGVSKASGLAVLCDALGISLDEVVAIGDSDNDRAALSVVGMPVAMGNATPAIKEMAGLIVADNDSDGIAEAIRVLF